MYACSARFAAALLIASGAAQVCVANEPAAAAALDGQARILELPNGETRVHMERDSAGEMAIGEKLSLTLERTEDRVVAFVTNADTDQTDQLFDLQVSTLPHRTLEARIADVNFDGIRDLLIETQIGYGGVNVFFNLYLGTETGFESQAAARDLSNPEIDTEQRQITTMQRSGPLWRRSIYLVSKGRPFHYMSATAAGNGMEYVQFLTHDGKLDQEMITDALPENPEDWEPLRIDLPEGAPFPLRGEPADGSTTSDALPDGSTIMVRRLSDDRKFALVEHTKTHVTGWLKTEWLPMPDGVRF